MATPDERRAQRFALLAALYEASDASTREFVEYVPLGRQLGLDDAATEKAAEYLVESGLAKFPAMAPVMSITHEGIQRAEELIRADIVTPPTLGLLPAEHALVESFLTAYQRAVDEGELHLEAKEQAEVDADIATMESQLRSPRPKRAIFRESFRSVRSILEGAAGGGLVIALQEAVRHFLR